MFKIYDGRTQFYQWDLNRKLLVTDDSITQVHFCNRNRETALPLAVYELDGNRVVDVPNILLQDGCPLSAYAYLDDHTKVVCVFTVKGRPKPEEYEYTETEVLTFSKMMERAEDAADAAAVSAGNAAASEQASEKNAESAGLSAKAAAGSAEQAAQSERNAKISEQNAGTHETNAGTFAAAAAQAKVAAEQAAANAANSEQAADTAAKNAATYAANAGQYAQNAGTHETNSKNALALAVEAANRAEKAASNVGGSGVDVTAEVGQTIIVKEVDENGKPTAWEAVEYQPRTHWSEAVEVLPETTFEVIEEIGAALLPDMAISAGDDLTVLYNGTEYRCSCADVAGYLYFGNYGVLVDPENPIDTGEPFAATLGNVDDDTLAWVLAPLDGSASFTLAITGEVVTKIPDKYIDYTTVDQKIAEANEIVIDNAVGEACKQTTIDLTNYIDGGLSGTAVELTGDIAEDIKSKISRYHFYGNPRLRVSFELNANGTLISCERVEMQTVEYSNHIWAIGFFPSASSLNGIDVGVRMLQIGCSSTSVYIRVVTFNTVNET